ncbi:hypothetical protein [Klenkia taihuensis]
MTLVDAAAQLHEVRDTAVAERSDKLLLCHGRPIA